MGYDAVPNTVDVSNSNTPGVIDPTDPVTSAYYRVVAEVNQNGKIHYTLTNAYSGNNGRAAILNNADGNDVLYTAGNAGNGGNPQPDGIIIGGGAQIVTAAARAGAGADAGPAARRSAASTSPSSATRSTRSARTPTSAA